MNGQEMHPLTKEQSDFAAESTVWYFDTLHTRDWTPTNSMTW